MKPKVLVESWRQFLREGVSGKIKVFLDMDGVLVDFAQGLADAINRDLANPDNPAFSKSRKKKLKKLMDYDGPDRQEPITVEILDTVLAKKDAKQEMTGWETQLKRYQFSPVVANYDHWVNLSKAEGCDELIQECFNLVGEENVYILSAPVDDESIRAKRDWLSMNTPFPDERIFITKTKEDIPAQFDGVTCVLIDDRIKYKTKFEAAGGIGIHHEPQSSMIAVEKSLNKLKGMI